MCKFSFSAAQFGHSSSIISAAFSPYGILAVTTNRTNKVYVWDIREDEGSVAGNLLATLKGHTNTVWDAVFCGTGKRIMTSGSDKTARLWDLQTGKVITVLSEHTGAVRTAKFSSGGTRAITASDDNTAIVWNVKMGKEITTFTEHADWVNSGEFSPDNNRIVTASDDWTARIWDPTTGKQIFILEGHSGYVNSAEFSPNGIYISVRQVLTEQRRYGMPKPVRYSLSWKDMIVRYTTPCSARTENRSQP